MYQIILSFLFLIVQMALFMYPKMILNVFILVPEGTFYVSNDTLFCFFYCADDTFMYPKIILNVFILVPEGTFYVSNDTLFYFFIVFFICTRVYILCIK